MMRATRPLSDRHLAWTLLAAGARSLFANWAVVAAGNVVIITLLLRWGDPAVVQPFLATARRILAPLTAIDGALIVLAVPIWGWSVMALLATLTVSGRNWVLLPGFVVPLAVGGLAVAVPPARLAQLDSAMGFAVETLLPWTIPALLTLMVLPVLLAPLSLSWNRHR